MVTHRYVGVVMGLLMLVWFLSGIVMLFVRWPELSGEARAAGLAPVDWSRCCAYGDTVEPQLTGDAIVESLAGRPVLRMDGETIDLTTGKPLAHLGAAEAWRVAADFAAATGLSGRPEAARLIQRDQWTVTGQFNRVRPLWRVRLSGPARVDLYVSAHSGQVVQKTDATGRALNWLGPIPHWLYPEILRQDGKLWTQVVIWTSAIGVFLTLTGLYLGVVAWRPWRDRRVTPFRGLMAWHHLAGLFAGLLTLSWVASGLVSMQPFGLFEGKPDASAQRITGEVTFGDVKGAIEAARAQGVVARQLTLAPLEGRTFLMADGVRLDATGRRAPLAEAELAAAGLRAGPVTHQEMIKAQDAYYHDGHNERAPMPAWRVVQPDGTRLYLDPVSGQPRARFDADAKAYRWLFEGLHRFDFIPGFDRGAGWTSAMVLLLVLSGAGVATGVWLGWRRITADVQALRTRQVTRRGRRASA